MSKKNRRKQRIARERDRAIAQTERAAQERRTQERAEVEMGEIHAAAPASLKMVPVNYAPSKGKPQYKHNTQSQDLLRKVNP